MLINLHGRETMYAITVPMVSFVALFTRDTGSTLESMVRSNAAAGCCMTLSENMYTI